MKQRIIFASIIFFFILVWLVTGQQQDNPQEQQNSNPYKASVRIVMRSGQGMGFCSGSIVEVDKEKGIGKILTAGHCLEKGPSTQYFIDFGDGTPQIQAQYVAHELTESPSKKDIGMLQVPIDIKDSPGYVEIESQTYSVNQGDNVFNLGYPGGKPLSLVGCKIRSLSAGGFGSGFSEVNFPPMGGRSGSGLFHSIDGSGKIFLRGKDIGIITHRDDQSGGGIFANLQQIHSFFNKHGIKIKNNEN